MSLRRTLAGLLFPLCLVGVTPALAGEMVYACGDLPVRAKLSGFGIEVYQGDDGWFFRKNELNHTFPMSDRSARFLRRLDAVLKVHDVQLVLMPLPTKSMLDAEHAAVASSANNIIFDPAYARAQFEQRLQSFRDLGLPVVDVLAEVDGAEKLESGYFFAQDLHWRPELARASARASAVALEATFPGEFPGTRSFVTRLKASGTQVHSANSRPLLNQLCGSAVEAEMVPVYETVEADQSVDAFLGDDSGVPPVSVIGTSFTDESLVYNFSGSPCIKDCPRRGCTRFGFGKCRITRYRRFCSVNFPFGIGHEWNGKSFLELFFIHLERRKRRLATMPSNARRCCASSATSTSS